MATNDVHKQLKLATVQAIQDLDLQGETAEEESNGFGIGTKVYDHLLPDEANVSYPCVIVTTEGERIEPLPGTTEEIDHVFPLRVFFADRDSRRRTEKETTYLSWRKQIYDRFRHKKQLGGITCNYWIDAVPQVTFDEKLPQYQVIVCGLVLRFFIREARGAVAEAGGDWFGSW